MLECFRIARPEDVAVVSALRRQIFGPEHFDLSLTPTISGVVRDESVNPVGGVIVEAYDTLGGIRAVVISDVLQMGLLHRTPRGRVATDLTYRHLGLEPQGGDQARLL